MKGRIETTRLARGESAVDRRRGLRAIKQNAAALDHVRRRSHELLGDDQRLGQTTP
jgi:hypothetical protein